MVDKTVTFTFVGKDGVTRTLEQVTSSSEKAAGAMESHASRIGNAFRGLDNQLGAFGIPFTGALSQIGSKLDEMGGKGQSAFQKLSQVGGLALGAVAVVGAGIAAESIHLADSFDTQQARLENAIKNSGGNFEQLSPQIQSAYDKMAKFGFNATDTASALTTLTNMTHDPQRALSLLGDTANFSAQYNKDLAFSAQAVGLAAEGQVGRLARLDPALKGITGGTVAVQKAQDGLQKALDNQAAVQAKVNDGSIKGADKFFALADAGKKVTDAQAKLNDAQSAGSDILHKLSETDMNAAQKKSETFQGQVKALSAELENIGIKIGQALVPIIETLVGWLTDVVDWFEKNQGAAIALGIVVGTVLTAAITAFAVNTAAKFIGSIKDMMTNLGLLATSSEETAATVEASSTEMAAAGAEGEASMAGMGEAAGGLALGPLALILGTAAGVAYGIAQIAESSDTAKVKFDGLAQNDVPALTKSLQDNQGTLDKLNGALDDYGLHVSNASVNHREFNQILEKSPQDADTFIAAVQKTGGNVSWYTQKLQDHMNQVELNKIKTDEYNTKLQILDAQTSGNADMAAHYKDQLFWLGVQEDQLHDKMFTVSIGGIGDAFAGLSSLQGEAGAVEQAVSRIHIPGMAHGGFVPGTGDTDSVPMMLTPGEYVVSKDMQRKGQWGPLGKTVNALPATGVGGPGGGGTEVIHVHLHLDGKEIHESLLRRNRQTGSLRFT